MFVFIIVNYFNKKHLLSKLKNNIDKL